MTVAIFTSDDLVIEPLSVNEWLESDQRCKQNGNGFWSDSHWTRWNGDGLMISNHWSNNPRMPQTLWLDLQSYFEVHNYTFLSLDDVWLVLRSERAFLCTAEPEVLCPSLEITGNCIQMIFFLVPVRSSRTRVRAV